MRCLYAEHVLSDSCISVTERFFNAGSVGNKRGMCSCRTRHFQKPGKEEFNCRVPPFTFLYETSCTVVSVVQFCGTVSHYSSSPTEAPLSDEFSRSKYCSEPISLSRLSGKCAESRYESEPPTITLLLDM